MKKKLGILLLLIGLSTVVFAEESSSLMSAGISTYIDSGVPMWEGSKGIVFETGLYGFFDFTYGEVSLGLGTYRFTDSELYGASLNFEILFKYPIAVDDFSFFPILGTKFNLPLSQSYKRNSVDGFKTSDHMRFGFQTGFGMDFPIDSRSYMRISTLFNINLFAPGDKIGDGNIFSVGPILKFGWGWNI
jgi:hypothetical protein